MYAYLKEKLKERVLENRPVRVTIVGAGFMGGAVSNRLAHTEGVRITGFASRKLVSAVSAMSEAGGARFRECHGAEDVRQALKDGVVPCFEDISLIPYTNPEIVIDLTRNIECGISLMGMALENGYHFIAGAEFDAVLGPLFAGKARERGLVYTNISGDEPGCIMDLYHYADLSGFNVIALGKFKAFLDPFATPETVLPWVPRRSSPWLISSAADGTKMSIEMTIVANATGFVPEVRGMHCPRASLEDIPGILSLKRDGGILGREKVVEVVSGAEPSGGVFAVVSGPEGLPGDSMKVNKMGSGPNYLLYTPYHMPPIEIIFSVLRAALLKDATIAPRGNPVADVVVHAKRDIRAGETLDGIGGFDYYGVIENASAARAEKALNLGIAKGSKVLRAVGRGEPIFLDDVEIDENTEISKLAGYFSA